jgi:large subunit ribosomal protein L5|tara:strand:- start:10 stop:549 length:540 start_codon:yes stop_codon:yes gene_type:complete
MARLKDLYNKEIKSSLKKKLGAKNDMAIPKLEKISINMGVGDAAQDKGKIEGAINDLKLISGQQPVITKARKSVAGFKLREGVSIGAKVTLRKEKMYEFLDRLVNIALPRVRDFRGLSKKSFDGSGNFSLGLKEQIVFPEIDYDNLDSLRGMDITIVTSAKNDNEGLELLKSFNMPINN